MKKDNKQKPQLANISEIPTGDRFPDALSFIHTPNQVLEVNKVSEYTYLFECQNSFTLKVDVLSDKIFRYRYAHEGKFEPDFSYQIAPGFNLSQTEVVFNESEGHFYIRTSHLNCQISKNDLSIEIYCLINQQLLNSDKAPVSVRRTIHKGVDKVLCTEKNEFG